VDSVAGFFSDLRFSIFLLFGLVFGAGAAAPIVLRHFQALFGQELSAGVMASVGVYLLLVCTVGTWASLGACGAWAGRHGGRALRFAVQVVGIALAAWMTLPLAIVVTLALMWWQGRKPKT